MSYLYVTSILVECWRPDDEDAAPISIPRGAYIPIVKKFTSNETETGAPQTLYWLKFRGDERDWVCAPQWYQAEEVESKPSADQQKSADVYRAGFEYVLVKVRPDDPDIPPTTSNPLLQNQVGERTQRQTTRVGPSRSTVLDGARREALRVDDLESEA